MRRDHEPRNLFGVQTGRFRKLIQPRTGNARLMIAQKVLARCGLSRAQVARDTGLNESTIWAWVKGKRVPGPDSLLKLAAGLERRGGDLQALADDLRKAAKELEG